MIVRQRYFCEEDEVCVRYVYNNFGVIAQFVEIDGASPLEKDEYTLPKIEVTEEMFQRIIQNPRLV